MNRIIPHDDGHTRRSAGNGQPAPQPPGKVLVAADTPPSQTAADARSAPADAADVRALLAAWAGTVTQQDERLSAIAEQIQQLGVDDAVFSELYAECRALREQHHQHQVLDPLLRRVIGLAARCRHGLAEVAGTYARNFDELPLAESVGLRAAAAARHADLVEMEALLAQYGVEPFRQAADRFDAATQHCVKRIPTSDAHRHLQIARRLLPGYRRGGVILQPEQVSVFVKE